MKWLFLCNLLAWVGMYIKEYLMPLIDWDLRERERESYFLSLFFGFATLCPLYMAYVLWYTSFPFVCIQLLLPIKKKIVPQIRWQFESR